MHHEIQRFIRLALYFSLGFLFSTWAVIASAGDTIVDLYSGRVDLSCSGTWTTDINSAGATAVACRNQVYPQYAPCTFTGMNGLIAQGTCGTPTVQNVVSVNARQECQPSGATPVGGQCPTQTCPAYGSPLSSGYYLIGTDPNASFPAVACQGGCLVSFSGTVPAKQAIVSGVTNYYAAGGYSYVGENQTCTGGAAAPGSLSAVPNNTCAAGQQQGTVNGKTVCVDPGTGQPVNTNAPTTSNKNNSSSTTTQNGDGSTSTNSTNQQSTTTCTGDECTTTTTTTTNGGAGAGGTTTTQTQTQSKGDFCQQNPSDKQCTGAGDDDDPKTDPGTGASTSDLYTKGTRTVGNVLGDFTTKVQNAPFYQAASNFFNVNVPAGACTDLSGSFNVGWGQSFTIDATPIFCGSTANIIYSVLSVGIMIAALWVAFKIAIL